MNRILFFCHELSTFSNISTPAVLHKDDIIFEVPAHDFRMQHIRNTLKSQQGDVLKAGVVNEHTGEIHILNIKNDKYVLQYHKLKHIDGQPKFRIALHMILAHVRPPVMARILRDLSAMQVESINVHISDLTEKSYIKSSIWKKRNDFLLEGLMQGGDEPRVPRVLLAHSVRDVLKKTYAILDNADDAKNIIKIYCHKDCNVSFIDTMQTLMAKHKNVSDILFAIGPERGYTDREIEILNQEGFCGVNLGTSILRSEVAIHLCTGVLNLMREDHC